MIFKNRKFLILGISKSGKSTCELIIKRGGECFFFDDNTSKISVESEKFLIEIGAKKVLEEDVERVLQSIDLVILSPGVPINHFIPVRAKALNKKITGEFQFGLDCLKPTLISVTGTNGKTTTVSILDNIFKSAGVECFTVGNIGTPITSKIDGIKNTDVILSEVSSFQLETAVDIKPDISCVLNITPDHLERHFSMDNYIFLKNRLLINQDKNDFSVLNFDDETVKNFSKNVKSNCVFVSLKERTDGGYILDGKIFYKEEEILNVSDLVLSGEHNLYNVLFAVSVSKIFGIDNDAIKQGILTFKGVPNRLELFKSYKGIDFYNDSKSTNTASTINAIKSMEKKTVLLLGGSEKGEDYDVLFNEIKNSLVKHIVISGASRFNMSSSAIKCGVLNFSLTENLKDAIKIACSLIDENENILLSPACASFDQFSDYEERGDKFKEYVEELF